VRPVRDESVPVVDALLSGRTNAATAAEVETMLPAGFDSCRVAERTQGGRAESIASRFVCMLGRLHVIARPANIGPC
jgi:hypothetical protein